MPGCPPTTAPACASGWCAPGSRPGSWTAPKRSWRATRASRHSPCRGGSPYRGRLTAAQRLFLAAGPYAGDQRDAVDRTTMVALLQRVPDDSFPELGSALSLLAQGDSLRAVAALRLA